MYDYYNFCLKARGAWPSVECLRDLSFVLYYVPEKGVFKLRGILGGMKEKRLGMMKSFKKYLLIFR